MPGVAAVGIQVEKLLRQICPEVFNGHAHYDVFLAATDDVGVMGDTSAETVASLADRVVRPASHPVAVTGANGSAP